jgi:hypothetical protein
MDQVIVGRASKTLGIAAAMAVGLGLPVTAEVTLRDQQFAVLEHNFHNTLALRSRGLEVPAPALSQYAFPDAQGYRPFSVQLKTVALMTTAPRAYILNGMGTGKTKSALWSFDALREQGLVSRCLVLCTVSTMEDTWAEEVKVTLPHLRVSVVKGDKARRLKALAADAEVYIINHDGIKVIEDEIRARPDIDCVIVDEFASFRNPTADRTKCLARILKQARFAWGMTATPCPKSPTDAYGQCKTLTPGCHGLPDRFKKWEDMVLVPGGPFRSQWKPKADAMDTVYRVMQPAVRFALDDIVELPPLHEHPVEVGMGPIQQRVYKQIRDEAYALVQKNEITAANAGVAANKLLQIATGFLYGSDGTVIQLDNTPRMDALVKSIREAKQKVLVFAPFRHALAGISQRLTLEGIEHGIVQGGVSGTKRAAIFKRFKNKDDGMGVILAHPRSMAHGLTLTIADTIVWFGPLFDLEIFEQANGRIRRFGQKNPQHFIYLQGSPAERKIYAMLRSRAAFQSNLLGLFKAGSA